MRKLCVALLCLLAWPAAYGQIPESAIGQSAAQKLAFVGRTNNFTLVQSVPTLRLTGTSNQLVLQYGGVTGTLTWTPTSTNKVLTLPDSTGTVAITASPTFTGTTQTSHLYVTGGFGAGCSGWTTAGGICLNRSSANPFLLLQTDATGIGQIRADSTANVIGFANAAGSSYQLVSNPTSGNVGIGIPLTGATPALPHNRLTVWGGDVSVIDPADLVSQTLTNTAMTGGASWGATTDCALASDKGTCSYSAGTASTITQASGALARALVANRWYRMTYTISGVSGTPAASIATTAAASAAALTLANGGQTLYFKSAASPTDFGIDTTLTAGQAWSIDNIALNQINGGDVLIGGKLTGGGANGIAIASGGAATFDVSPIIPTHTPATSGEACTAGTITWDADYIYVCVAANTWRRGGIATW